MSLPDVNIARSNNNLNRTASTPDNVFGLVLSGALVATKINLNEPKLIQSTDDLTTLGITLANNPLAYKEITAFYAKATPGTDLYIMLFDPEISIATVSDKDTGTIKDMLDFAEGRICGVFINKTLPNDYTSDIVTGLEQEVWDAVTILQALCVAYGVKNQPLFSVLPGLGFTTATANALKDLNTMTDNEVTILLAADDNTGKPAIGGLAGWLAKVTIDKGTPPINRYWQNAGRVADGAFADNAWFIDGTPANDASITNLLGDIHDKRFMFLKKFIGKSGFFFNDDPCACAKTDDFSSISWNRVANKAQRVTYNVLVDKLNDDVEANPLSGGISISLAADWESDVETQLNAQMTKLGAITKCKVTVDTDNSNLANDEVNAEIEIVRKGQAKSFNVTIAYTPTL